MTGGRLKRLSKYLKNDTFLMTYGDGVSNINVKRLIEFHKKNNKELTLTVVSSPARFGVVKFKNNLVTYFKEKSKVDEGWINGGFFVVNPSFLKKIKNDRTFLEKEPLKKVCKNKNLVAYKHKGFWQCVDTKRDLEKLKKKHKQDKNLKKRLNFFDYRWYRFHRLSFGQ